jgi:hypothetical protein
MQDGLFSLIRGPCKWHHDDVSKSVSGMLGERGLGLVDHVPSGYVAKINVP